jgi:hypothetical protein
MVAGQIKIRLFIAALAFALGDSPASAADYLIQGGIGQAIPSFAAYSSYGSFDMSVPVPVGRELRYDQNGDAANHVASVHMQTNVLTEPFAFHGHSFVQVIKPFSSVTDNREIRLTASSNTYVQGLTSSITGPAGNVTATLNMHLSGTAASGTSFTPDSLYSPRADNFLSLSLRVNGLNVIDGQYGVSVTDGGAPVIFEAGKIVNYNGNMIIVSNPFTVPTNTPFTIDVVFATVANVSYAPNESFTAQTNIDFGSTFSFATDRPVFNLPAGYSAQSAEIGITDNALILPVPEPASLALLIPAAVLVLRRHRRL